MTVPVPRFGFPIGPWRRWFAWWPVQTFDGVWRWLKPVVRRRIQKHDHLPYGGTEEWWQYALPGDVVPIPTTAAHGAQS